MDISTEGHTYTPELISMILESITIKKRLKLRSVCKEWSQMIALQVEEIHPNFECDDERFIDILYTFANVKHVSLTDDRRDKAWSERALKMLAMMPRIISLDVRVDTKQEASVIRHMSNLKNLSIICESHRGFNALVHRPWSIKDTLERLELSVDEMVGLFVVADLLLENMSNLKYLDTSCGLFDSGYILQEANLSSLRELYLYGFDYRYDIDVKSFPRLEDLSLENIHSHSRVDEPNDQNKISRIFNELQELSNIRTISLVHLDCSEHAKDIKRLKIFKPEIKIDLIRADSDFYSDDSGLDEY